MPKVRRSQRSQSLDHSSDPSKTGASALELGHMRTVMLVFLSSGVRGNPCECLFVSESPAVSFDPENSGSDQEESSFYTSFL